MPRTVAPCDNPIQLSGPSDLPVQATLCADENHISFDWTWKGRQKPSNITLGSFNLVQEWKHLDTAFKRSICPNGTLVGADGCEVDTTQSDKCNLNLSEATTSLNNANERLSTLETQAKTRTDELRSANRRVTALETQAKTRTDELRSANGRVTALEAQATTRTDEFLKKSYTSRRESKRAPDLQ